MSLSSTHLSEDSETVSYTEPGNVQIRFLMVYKFAFVLFLITECLSHSVLESVVVPLRLPIYAVILIMLSLKISTQRYSYRAGALSLMIIILGTVSGVFANSLSIMMTCFFIVASQG
ncbi:MAG: hypothetical protein FWF71_01620, partial [Actinomycetia bacterium]|nr:hypothetical protein [Actinomycetes bacterium]